MKIGDVVSFYNTKRIGIILDKIRLPGNLRDNYVVYWFEINEVVKYYESFELMEIK